MSTYGNAAQRPLRRTGSGPRAHHATLHVRSKAEAHQAKSLRPRALRTPSHVCPGRDELAVKLLSLVRRVAFEMRERLPQHVEVDDLAGAGAVGLLDAVRKFDARKHVKIETYARYRIRGAILDSLREMDTASRDMRRKSKAAEKAYHQLQTKLGRAVTDEDMASALGISLKKWHRTVQEINSVGSEWMRPNQIPEPSIVNEANIPADNRDDAFDLCYRQEQRNILTKASSELPERERTVISLYYWQEMTMNQIGAALKIDESRVSQIHSAAISHLRSKVRKMLNPGQKGLPPVFIAAQATTRIEKAY